MKSMILIDFKSTYSEANLLVFARNALTRLKSNPNFPTLQSPLIDTELQGAVDRFDVALQEAADRSRTKIAVKKAAYDVLITVLQKTATHVSFYADGDETKVVDAGFNLRQRAGARSIDATVMLDQVKGQRAMQGAMPGEAILEFRKVFGARIYAVEWSADNGETWHNGTYTTKRRVSLTGLPVRQVLLIRVRALGSGQRKGAPSDPVQLFLM